jgi:hypothetical protein
MALTFLYRDLDATDTDVTEFVVLRFGQNPQGMAENAEERSVGAWDLEIEDNGVLDLHAQRTFYVLEDDTYDTDNVLWVGQTFDKHSVRGDIKRTGAGRVYTLSLIDLNTLLERRVIQEGDDPNRPAETDVERMQWLEGLGYIGGPSDYLSTADPVDMDAVDYTGRMASEVIEDCMGQSGKNSFMFRDPDNNIFSTFYGDSSGDTDVLTSDIRLSNVLSDIDNVTTFEVNLDADQWEANSRIYSGIFASYDGGAVYQENATTVANFSHRDTSVSWPDVKTTTKANARAIRYLADIGTEEIRITTALEMGSDQVGLFPHAGYRLLARFSHFPLFALHFTWMRILSRNTTLIGPNRYRIQYELSPGTPGGPAGTCLSSVSTADETADSGDVNSASGLSLAVGTMPAAPGVSIGSWVASSGTGFLSGPGPGISAPWTLLETVAPSSVHTAMFTGYYRSATVVAPPNMPCSVVNGSGGDPGGRAIVTSFPTSSATPVQSASANGGSTVVLGGAPTAGNILHMIACGEGGLSIGTEWTVVARETLSGFTVGGGGVDIVHCIRCVDPGESAAVPSVASAFAHYAAISEWAP